MTDLSKAFREKCRERYDYTALEEVRVQQSGLDGTRKFLFGLSDHQLFNGVSVGNGHQLFPLPVRSGMQGQGKGELQLLVCQPVGARIRAFQKKLEAEKINSTVRREMGRDIDGACGQLRRRHIGSLPDSEGVGRVCSK